MFKELVNALLIFGHLPVQAKSISPVEHERLMQEMQRQKTPDSSHRILPKYKLVRIINKLGRLVEYTFSYLETTTIRLHNGHLKTYTLIEPMAYQSNGVVNFFLQD